MLDIYKKQDQIFEKSLRENAIPKIKGDITKGKLRWRGIRMVQVNGIMNTEKWLEQRGVQISPKVILDFTKSYFNA